MIFLSQLDNIQTQDLIFALDQPMVESAQTPSSEMASSARFSNVSAMDNSEVIFPVFIMWSCYNYHIIHLECLLINKYMLI